VNAYAHLLEVMRVPDIARFVPPIPPPPIPVDPNMPDPAVEADIAREDAKAQSDMARKDMETQAKIEREASRMATDTAQQAKGDAAMVAEAQDDDFDKLYREILAAGREQQLAQDAQIPAGAVQ
jgi:hypothetical protein